jgi:hypothetical protein
MNKKKRKSTLFQLLSKTIWEGKAKTNKNHCQEQHFQIFAS